MKTQESETKTLVLRNRPELIDELKNLVAEGNTEVDCQKIRDSQFCKEVDEVVILDAGGFSGTYAEGTTFVEKLEYSVIELITKIAAASPKLKSLSLKSNNLGENALELANIISDSHSLETINMSSNSIRKHAPAVAQALTKGYHPRMEIDLNNNVLGYNNTIKTIQTLFGLHFPISISICDNHLHLEAGGAPQNEPHHLSIKRICDEYKDVVTNNIEKLFLFYCGTRSYLPVETVCEIAGNIGFCDIDLNLTEYQI